MKTKYPLLAILTFICVTLTFQNCQRASVPGPSQDSKTGTDGTTVGNPKPTQMNFEAFDNRNIEVQLCLSNILLRLKDYNPSSPLPKIEGFDTFYSYYDPTEQRYFINALVNKVIKLDPAGTPIGNFNIPQTLYDRIAFGFSKCGSQSVSLQLKNGYGQYSDLPQEFFALVYDGERSLSESSGNVFEIKSFIRSLDSVKSQNELQQTLQPYRRFEVIGFTQTKILNQNTIRMRKLSQQSSGKVMAFGFGNVNGDGAVALVARYHQNGQLDTSFGTDVNRPGIVSLMQRDKYLQGATGTLGPDNSVFVITQSPPNTAIIKLNSEGVIDTKFGNKGTVTVDAGGINEYPQDAIVDQDGRIVFVGVNEDHQMFVGRLLVDGSLDRSFGSTGLIKLDFVSYGYGDAITIKQQNDKKFIISASSNANTEVSWMALRLNEDGSIDKSFNTSGRRPGYFIYDFGFSTHSFVNSHVIQSDGKIVLCGSGAGDFAALRLQPDGTLDKSFSNNGVFTKKFGDSSSATGCVLDVSEKIILTGDTKQNEIFSFLLVALDKTGKIDSLSNDPGYRIYSLNAGAQGADMIQSPTGNIYLGGNDDFSFNLLTISK